MNSTSDGASLSLPCLSLSLSSSSSRRSPLSSPTSICSLTSSYRPAQNYSVYLTSAPVLCLPLHLIQLCLQHPMLNLSLSRCGRRMSTASGAAHRRSDKLKMSVATRLLIEGVAFASGISNGGFIARTSTASSDGMSHVSAQSHNCSSQRSRCCSNCLQISSLVFTCQSQNGPMIRSRAIKCHCHRFITQILQAVARLLRSLCVPMTC